MPQPGPQSGPPLGPQPGLPPGPPIPTPPLPPPRGRGPAALIAFGVLAALVIIGGGWALVSLAAGSLPTGSRADAPVSSDAPIPPGPLDPTDPGGTTADPDPGGQSSGPSGQVTVSWTLSDVQYRAELTTSGATGNAVVTYTDPQEGQVRTVRQDVQLASAQGQRAYVGSDPIDVDTGGPAAYYAPDVFVLSTNADGTVYISQVCDTSGTCVPATME